MVMYTRNAQKIQRKNFFIEEYDDDDDDDSDYIPPSSNGEEDEESEYDDSTMTENLSEEEGVDNISYNDMLTNVALPILDRKKTTLTSPEFQAMLKRVSELDPDIYKFLTSDHVKDKDKIRLCELYTILISQDMFSVEWIEIRSIIKHEMKKISRKMCFFKDADKTNLDQKMLEFKHVKNHFDTPLKERIILLDAPVETKSAIYAKYKELSEYAMGDTEYAKIYTWLQHALSVPYNIIKPLSITSENICDFLNNVYTKLNLEFYGLQKVKEQILLFLNMKLTNPNSKNYNLALLGSKGVGKCFARDTPILMHNFSTKAVQDIKCGDRVMGKDGKPRIVGIYIQGFTKMYTVYQKYSDNYKVSEGHLLVLRCIKEATWLDKKLYKMYNKPGDEVKIQVELFHKLPDRIKKNFVAINLPIERYGYTSSNFDIEPYLLAMWFGQGNILTPYLTVSDKLTNILSVCATKLHSTLHTLSKGHDMSVHEFKLYDTEFLSFEQKLKQLGVWGKWGIPRIYRNASVIDRCRFVAGFLDVNGVVLERAIQCDLSHTNSDFVREFVAIVRSIGLYCTMPSSAMIHVTGKFSNIPLKVCVIDDITVYNTVKTQQTSWNHYYGFEVNDDHMFMLEDYTLVHNCFAADTPIQMYNGDIKNVQDVKSGDLLMGDDLTSRTVVDVTTGREEMYTIQQTNGIQYTVNKSHILSLYLPKYNHLYDDMYRIFRYDVSNQIRYYDIMDGSNVYCDIDYCHDAYYIDMTVEEYLTLSTEIQPFLLGYKKASVKPVHDIRATENNVTSGILYGLTRLRKSTFRLPRELEYLHLPFSQVYEGTYYNMYTIAGISNSCNLSTEFLAGLLITLLNYSDDEWVLNNVNAYNHFYNKLNINVSACLEHMSCLQLISRLICHDPLLNCFSFKSDITVTYSHVGAYYGFTLGDDSPNRRFLLSDGTVVHNTHISRTLASIMDFPFEQISMGNVTNAEILTGHQYTYVGSRPGAILNALTDMKYKNGIIFLDEFDKVQNVDISNTLLHIVDTTQNHQFVDNYLGQQIKIDLSNIWFIFAMNNVPESGPLRDRIFVIEIDGYNMNEKCIITRDYLLPRVCKNAGLQPTDVCINEDVTRYLVTKFTTPDEMDNQGVRYIEKKLTDFINKIMFLVNTGSCFTDLSFSIKQQLTYPVNISRDLIDSLLTTSTKIAPYRHMYS